MRWHLRPWVFGVALALAAGAALPDFLREEGGTRSFFFEVTLAADGRGYAQVFYDLGEGFREQDSTRRDLNGATSPAVYRLALPRGLYRALRFDPIDHAGAASFSGARIVDSRGRVFRSFAPGDFRPAHDIASLVRNGGTLEMRTPAGGDDPYLIIDTGGPFVLGLDLWDRVLGSLPMFLIVFAAAFSVGSLLPENLVQGLRLGDGRWMIGGALLLVAFKIWLIAGQTVYAIGPAAHDDRLFLEQASSLLAGRWLGPYSQFTLMKGPAYSLFVAGVFVLGVPLFVAQHVLYALACWALVAALRPLATGRGPRAAIFAVLLFNPVTYDGIRLMRVSRQALLPALTLMIVAGLVALYARRAGPKRGMLPWAILTGAALPAFWLTREDGVWLLPCIAILWLAAVAAVWRGTLSDRNARLALLALPALGWAAGMAIISAVNLQHYGLFTTCEFRRTEFRDAYGALMRVEPAVWRPGVVVPREARARIYAVSPAFAELRSYLEGPGGVGWAAASQGITHLPSSEREFAGGWFVWALRDAVMSSGHGRSGSDAMAFYARLAREVNEACDSGLLKAGPRRSGFEPPLRRELFGPIVSSSLESARLAFLFQGLYVESPPSQGDPASLAIFSDLTRGRLSPVPGGAHLWPKQSWLDRVRLGILGQIGVAYAWIAPWAVGAGVLAFLGAIAGAIARRRFPYFAVVGAASLASVCSMVAICGLLDATSFHAADVGYLTGCYGLVLLFVFTGWPALVGALRRGSR
jgi:hypothetical protein